MRGIEPRAGQQDDPAAATPFGVHGHACHPERLDVPQHGPPGHLQSLGELGGGDALPCLQEQ